LTLARRPLPELPGGGFNHFFGVVRDGDVSLDQFRRGHRDIEFDDAMPAGELVLEAIESHVFVDADLIAAVFTHDDENSDGVRAHQRFPLAAAGLPAISTTNLSRQCINSVTHIAPHFGVRLCRALFAEAD
jgi:hypothetical protein